MCSISIIAHYKLGRQRFCCFSQIQTDKYNQSIDVNILSQVRWPGPVPIVSHPVAEVISCVSQKIRNMDARRSKESSGNQPAYNGDVVCAACGAANGRTTSIMMPARLKSPTGWTKEYSDHFVAQCDSVCGQDRHITSYVCVDEAPEVRDGGTSAENNWE